MVLFYFCILATERVVWQVNMCILQSLNHCQIITSIEEMLSFISEKWIQLLSCKCFHP